MNEFVDGCGNYLFQQLRQAFLLSGCTRIYGLNIDISGDKAGGRNPRPGNMTALVTTPERASDSSSGKMYQSVEKARFSPKSSSQESWGQNKLTIYVFWRDDDSAFIQCEHRLGFGQKAEPSCLGQFKKCHSAPHIHTYFTYSFLYQFIISSTASSKAFIRTPILLLKIDLQNTSQNLLSRPFQQSHWSSITTLLKWQNPTPNFSTKRWIQRRHL